MNEHFEYRFTHSSGRFDRKVGTVRDSVTRLHKISDLTTHTEMSPNDRDKAFKHQKGWAFTHLENGAGTDECIVDWRTDAFSLRHRGSYALQLTNRTWVRSGDYGGRPADFVHGLFVPLMTVDEVELDVIVLHSPLDNTSLRADIWVEVMDNLTKIVAGKKKRHPKRKFWIASDFNKNFRQANERAMIQTHLAAPLKMKQAWEGHIPDHGGTHGPLSLLDGAVTNIKIEDTFLITDDASSDHRPWGSVVSM